MKKIITIDGMACEHCVSSVKNALEKLDGVKSVKVELKKKSATVKLNDNIADDVLKSAVTLAGFTPISVIEK